MLKSKFKLRWLFAGILLSCFIAYVVLPATSQALGYVRFRDVPTESLVEAGKREMLDAISVKATGVAIDAYPFSDNSSEWRIASEAWARQSREISKGHLLSRVDAHARGLAVDPAIRTQVLERDNHWNGPVLRLVVQVTDGICKSALSEKPLHRCLKKQVQWGYDHIFLRFTEVQGQWHVAEIYAEDWYSDETNYWHTLHGPEWFSCYTYDNGLKDC